MCHLIAAAKDMIGIVIIRFEAVARDFCLYLNSGMYCFVLRVIVSSNMKGTGEEVVDRCAV